MPVYRKCLYSGINITVTLLTVLLFWYECKDISIGFFRSGVYSFFVLSAVVMLVHIIKSARLYLALYGSNINLFVYLKTYCRVTPVSMVAPFKLGEFFRMYSYGVLLESVLKGVVIILFDRFMDTIALITAIVLVWIFNGDQIAPFVYLLLAFLVFFLLIYSSYPGVYKFWKKYLLRAKASPNRLAVLKMLERLNLLYQEVENVTRGRGVILYFMSLVAWGVEIGSLAILNEIEGKGKAGQIISDYLVSAMTGGQCIEMKKFVIVSVVLLAILYLMAEAGRSFVGKKDRK